MSHVTNIDFIGKRKIAFALSALLVLASIAALAIKGLNFGIDFTGGTLIEVAYDNDVQIPTVRKQLASDGFTDATVQYFGSAHNLVIRLAPRDGDKAALSADVMRSLSALDNSVQMRRIEFVGPKVGEELSNDGGLAMLIALLGILVYVMMRFEWRFSLGSVAALIHDVMITLGFFAVTQMEFDLSVLAAVLAVIGYSLNDTIVVFDRIRENFRKMRKVVPEEVMNSSINQTLSRTLITSGTTLLVLFALFVLGGSVIHSFATALIVGIGVGTYSSIYVASSLALLMGVSKEDLMPKAVEEVDDRP